MTLAAKSPSSCSSGSSDEIEKQLKEDIEEEIKEEIKKENKEKIEEKIEEEIKEEIEEEIEYATYLQNEIERQIKEEMKKENKEEIEKEIEEEIKEEIEEEFEEEFEKEIEEEIEVETKLAEQRNKRLKVTDESTDEETEAETVEVAAREISNEAGNVKCSHPAVIKNLCSHCGVVVEEAESSVAFNYIHKDLRLQPSEIEKLRKEYMKDLLKDKKLILVLDLDYTLLNSARLIDLTPEEDYLSEQLDEDEDDMNQTLFELDRYQMLTKLRPFVHTFLKEASNLFEMYIYTMGERGYAMECAKLLDPGGVYFPSRVICRSDNTTMNQKGLDVVIGSENMVIILDDTEQVWQKHKENLILIKRYYFFAYGPRQYNIDIESLSEDMEDESESDGILASILNVLKRAHELFFDLEIKIDFATRDVRQILQLIKMDILHNCDIVFSNVFPSSVWPKEQPLWKFAEAMGARCYSALDDSVTHVVAKVPTTGKVKWARENNKFVVTPQWIEEANYLWKRQKEEDFPVLDKNDQ